MMLRILYSARAACVIASLMLPGCQSKFEPSGPRAVSEIRWDDYDGDGHDEPRQSEGVEYSWHSKGD